jgi:tetratricopeptide (TPR) repeat protein
MQRSVTFVVWGLSILLQGPICVAQGPPPSPPPNRSRIADQERRGYIAHPTLLSGHVVLDDGKPAPETTVILRVCDYATFQETLVQAKGRFDVDLSAKLAATGNELAAPRNAVNPLVHCKFRALLPGYESSEIDISKSPIGEHTEVGTITLTRRAGVAGASARPTPPQAPDNAKKAYAKALEAHKKGNSDEAQKSLEKAVQLYPLYTVAWTMLGDLHKSKNEIGAAKQAYAAAVLADPQYVYPYEGLAWLALLLQDWNETRDYSAKLLALDPVDFPRAWFYNAVANYRLRDFDAAEKSAREAIKVDKSHEVPQAEFQLGLILVQKKDVPGAVEHMRAYLAANPNGEDAAAAKAQLAALGK